MRSMKLLDRTTVALQKDNETTTKTCYYFNMAITHFRELAQRLQEDLPIVCDVAFESEIRKIQRKLCQDLSKAETAAVQHLQKGTEHITVSGDSDPLLSEIVDNQIHKQKNGGSKYTDMPFLLKTSNHFENLFCVPCSSSTNTRRSMSLTTFETSMFFFQIEL